MRDFLPIAYSIVAVIGGASSALAQWRVTHVIDEQAASADSPALISPAAAAVVTTATPTFTWDTFSGVQWSGLFIYSGATLTDESQLRIYEEGDIVGTTFTIPAGDALSTGQYSWYVVASTMAADYQSETRTFIVSLCAADFNGDTVRDVADLFGYINAWLAKTPNADFNHDSVVDVADLFGFINAWLAGC